MQVKHLILFSIVILQFLNVQLIVSDPRYFDRTTEKINEFINSLNAFLDAFFQEMIIVGQHICVLIILIGFILWASQIFSYLGRRLIIGGFILWIFLHIIS